jgi:lysylphosphatidylglycerol synthetase-like protein (DUF2156 family)
MKSTFFIIWMFLTFILTLSIIGWFVLAKDDYNNKSTWMQIGFDLMNQLKDEKKP